MKQPNTKQEFIEPVIKRAVAAAVLNLTPGTLRRYEIQGKLAPIHRGTNQVLYKVCEVEKLQRGESATPEPARPLIPATRNARGQFARVKA